MSWIFNLSFITIFKITSCKIITRYYVLHNSNQCWHKKRCPLKRDRLSGIFKLQEKPKKWQGMCDATIFGHKLISQWIMPAHIFQNLCNDILILVLGNKTYIYKTASFVASLGLAGRLNFKHYIQDQNSGPTRVPLHSLHNLIIQTTVK